jgi:hypothetical protein
VSGRNVQTEVDWVSENMFVEYPSEALDKVVSSGSDLAVAVANQWIPLFNSRTK